MVEPSSQTRSRSTTSLHQPNPLSPSTAASQTSSKSSQHKGETVAQEIKHWQEKDADMRAESRRELQEIRKGGDGTKAEREYEEKIKAKEVAGTNHLHQVESSENLDLDLDLEAQTSSDHSTQVEEPPSTTEKAPSSSSRNSHQSQQPDPNIVTWDSPDDPYNPRNWSKRRKWAVALSEW